MTCIECGREYDGTNGKRWLCVEVWGPDEADYLCPSCQGDHE